MMLNFFTISSNFDSLRPVHNTCKFSQLFDLESRAHTRPSSPFTFRLADVRLPRYLRGLLCALPGWLADPPPMLPVSAHCCESAATGAIGELGFEPAALPPARHALPSGEQARRFDFRYDRFRNKSLR